MSEELTVLSQEHGKNVGEGTSSMSVLHSSSHSCHKAVVLAAGFGTRLRPFTAAVPKPLLPVWGEPMLARVVNWLREQGVDDIVVNCHYLHEQIEDWCAKNGCRAIYEPEILGTGGVLNPLRDWIGNDDFYLVNGDIVFDGDVSSFHRSIVSLSNDQTIKPSNDKTTKRSNDKTIKRSNGQTIKRSNDQTTLGWCIVTEEGPRTIEVEPEGNLVTNWHSPDPGWNGTWTYCGIALLKAKVLEYVKPSGFSSIIEAYEAAMMDGNFIKAIAPENFLWTDAGTVDSYIALNQDGPDNSFADIPQIKLIVESGKLKVGDPTLNSQLSTLNFLGARGSDRAFFKTKDAYIIVYDDEKRPENARYAGHARWLKEHGIHVPEVLADCPQMKTLALENAGSEDLKARSRTRGEDRLYDYVAVVEELAKFNALTTNTPPLEPPFDAALYKWERDLFKEHCLGTRFHIEMPEAVEKELESVAERLLKEPPALVHRDFQSTNVMWKGQGPRVKGQGPRVKGQGPGAEGQGDEGQDKLSTLNSQLSTFSIIDFQGMRMGAAAYDLASLLYDPYVDLREGERRALAALYAKKSGRQEILEVLPYAAVERLVQALGAFGRLASVGKPEFGKFVLPALQNLLAAADEAGLDATGALAEDLIAKEGTRAKGQGSRVEGQGTRAKGQGTRVNGGINDKGCAIPSPLDPGPLTLDPSPLTLGPSPLTLDPHHHHHDGCKCGHHHHSEEEP